MEGRLSSAKDEQDDGESGGEEQAHDVAADEDHQDPAYPHGNAVVGLDGVVGEHVAEKLAAVEGRDGKQVEEKKCQINLHGGNAEQHDGLHRGGYVGEKSAVKGEVDDLAAARHGV